MEVQQRKIKICVIGAGAAGLCAVRHLATNLIFEVTAYEQTNDVGGTWVYKEQVGLDENDLPIHSSMYQNLRFDICFYLLIISYIMIIWIRFVSRMMRIMHHLSLFNVH